MGKILHLEQNRGGQRETPRNAIAYPLAYNELTVAELPPLLADIWEEIGTVVLPRYGVCRFCGQVREDIPREYRSGVVLPTDLDEYATRTCPCPDAKTYADRLRREQEKIDRRMTAQEMVDETIDEMFGESAPGYGKLTIKEETRAYLAQTAMMVYDRKMRGATVDVTAGIKVKISRSTKDVLKIKRADSSSWEEEVDG